MAMMGRTMRSAKMNAFLDPVAALVIAGIAPKEGRDGWRGEDTCCAPMPRLDATTGGPSADK
jgi:hypothetical protein